MAMQEIRGGARTVEAFLSDTYAMDYYQREYKWETKQIQELLDDLTTNFIENYSQSTRPRRSKDTVATFSAQSLLVERTS